MSGENLDKSCKSNGKIRCARPGKKVRNSFLMFLRTYRPQHCGRTMPQLAKEAARIWNHMSCGEKQKYKKEAMCTPISRRKRRSKLAACGPRKMKVRSRMSSCKPRRSKKKSC